MSVANLTWQPVRQPSAVAEFRLNEDFIDRYAGKQPQFGPIGYVSYKRTYARSLQGTKQNGSMIYSVPERIRALGHTYGLKKSEEFWLTLVRVIEGTYEIQRQHCEQLGLHWDIEKAQESAQEMYDLAWQFKWLPPGRGLWMMGTDNVKRLGGAALNNCGFTSTKNLVDDFSGPFCWLMDMSMLGVGVGGDTRGAGTVQLQRPELGDEHVVEDSREGWVALVRRVLESYVGKTTLPVTIDYGLVRPAGAPILGFGGTSSGPGPLAELIRDIARTLDPLIGETITSTAIADLFNLIGKCVVSGNVRRSAEVLIGSPDDAEFLALKDPTQNDWSLANHRWASNNSIFAEVGQDYTEVAKRTAKNGEPGYCWLENIRAFSRMDGNADYKDAKAEGLNPCGEQCLESYELCCLVETFPSRHATYEEYERTLRYAYLYAKSVTLVSTHDRRTNAVMLRNRRIGTSMSGIVQAFKRHGRAKFLTWCDKGYSFIKRRDEVYSNWLCVRPSIKVTSVKPSGTVSLLAGVTPGIHYPAAEYYFRTIRFATDSPMVTEFRAAGYTCVELDRNKQPNTTVVYFAVREEYFDRCESDVTMWEQLENAAAIQRYWSDNAVSCTVKFKATEADQIPHALELYQTRLKDISFLPASTHGYEHAPYQPIDRDRYEEYNQQIKSVDLAAAMNEVVERFCDGDKCTI